MGRISKLSFVLVMVSCFGLVAQNLTPAQFLKSALEDPFYKSFEAQDAYLRNNRNFSLPWVEDIQFRYRDNEFQDMDQRYALRVDPGNPWQISHNKKYFQGIRVLKGLEQQMALKEILKERYVMVVEYWMAVEEADWIKEHKRKREEIGLALAKKAGSTAFDADQYLNSQIDIIAKEADLQEAVLERDVALTRILSSSLETSFDLNVHDLISIDQINQLIQPEIISANKTELDFLRQRIALSDQKIKLERSNINLGFIQPMYTNRNNRERSPGGFAFGVTIPLFNSNRDDVAREKLDQLERQGELEKFQTEEKRKRLTTLAYLQLHFNHYQKLDSLINAFRSRGMNILTGTSHNYDPIIELKYQEKMIQFEILKTRIKKEILAAYIDWLDCADKLQGRPLINYLAKDLTRLED